MSDAVDDGPWLTVDHARRRQRRRSIPRDAFSFVSHFFFYVLDIVEKVTISNDSSVGVLAIDTHVVQRFEIVLFALLFPEAFEILLRVTPFFVLRFQPTQREKDETCGICVRQSNRFKTIGTATRGFCFKPSMISLARSP